MNYKNVMLFVFCSLLVVSCVTDSNSTEGKFQSDGISNSEVNTLKSQDDILYAGTDKGLIRKNTREESENDWQSMGLQDKDVLDFVIWNSQELLVGKSISSSEDVSIFVTHDGGKNWQEYQNGFGNSDKNNPLAIVEKHPQKSEVLYGRGDFNVAMSSDSGKSWKNLVGSWDGFGAGYFLKIDPLNPNIIWAGGTTATFSPHLFKSSDAGASWQNIETVEKAETTVYDLLTNISNSKQVLAALKGGIRKSTDGGESWQTVLQGYNIRTLTHSSRNPEIVYAGGINENGTLFFAASENFGESWEIVEWEDSPAGVRVNDMISVIENGREVLYFGTSQGIFSYRFER